MDIIKSSLLVFISSIVRNLLAVGLTWLVSRKLIDESASSQLLTIGPIVIGAIAWSLIEKYVIGKLHLEKVLAALNLPAGSTQENLKDALTQKTTPTA